jgi:Zn-dependent protease
MNMVQFTTVQIVAISVLPVLFAITVHEVAHGWVASKFGDQTARLSGRLTLNPLKHIDLVGTIIVPMLLLLFSNFIFGWAKPVPVDARNMRNPRWNMALVAFAGPFSNMLMALFWAGIGRLSFMFIETNPWLAKPLVYMGEVGILINIVLAIINCLPVPPLDGGKILCSVLPPRVAWHITKLEPYMFIFFILLILTGALSYIILPPIQFLTQAITTLFGLPQLVV